MPAIARRPRYEETAQLYCDGFSAPEIAEKLNAPIRTVYDWLKRPEVQKRIENELNFRITTRRREIARHYRRLYDFAADVAEGSKKIENDYQARMLDAFLGLETSHASQAVPALATQEATPPLALPEGAPQIPAGATVILQYNGDGPREPRVARGLDDDADVIEADRA